MYIALALYWSGSFGCDIVDWVQINRAAQNAFGWEPLQYVVARGASGERGIGHTALNQSTLRRLASGFAQRKFDTIVITERSVEDERTRPDPRNVAMLSVRFRPVSTNSRDEPVALPFELSLSAEVDVAWPSLEQQGSLLELASLLPCRYGCLHVGGDRNRARSEQLLATYQEMGKPDSPWTSEIHHMARNRHHFGEKVRGAYWANFLNSQSVEKIGGTTALQATGAASVETLPHGLTYIQLTPNVRESLGELGLERLERLRRLLGPVTV